MQKIIVALLLLSILVLSACSSSQIAGEVTNTPTQSSPTVQEVKTGGCPRGIEGDTYPGICPLYTDKNNNGECDFGE